MPSLEAVRAAKAAVRAKLDSEGLDIISIGIENSGKAAALAVGVAKLPGRARLRRSIAGVDVFLFETETPTLHVRKTSRLDRRKRIAG